ncbi:hypothetical protein SAMN04515695_2444 [Pseudovibrio sp. Tun.PSC04-5.I4]|nr:hypothetical protein SAMN04515695_2444 [Pseudovibrio sp. Tun.PSC04-5.I4]
MLVVLSFADKTFQPMFEFRKAGLCTGFFVELSYFLFKRREI